MNRVQDRFPEVDDSAILGIIEGLDKTRFEFREGMVRATYGHAFPIGLEPPRESPPQCLSCGTTQDLAKSILEDGLKPREHQFVHLSLSLKRPMPWERGAILFRLFWWFSPWQLIPKVSTSITPVHCS